MTRGDLKVFITDLKIAMADLVTAGTLTADEAKIVAKEAMRSRFDKEHLEMETP